MKELHARAQSAVTASPDEALALLRAVEGYPELVPLGSLRVPGASVLVRDARPAWPSKVRASAPRRRTGPFVKDFNLTLAVTDPAPGKVKLARQPHGPRRPRALRGHLDGQRPARRGATVALTFDANLWSRASSRSTASPTGSPATTSTPPPVSSAASRLPGTTQARR